MTRIKIKYMSDPAIAYLKANVDFVTKKLLEHPDSSEWLKTCIDGEIYVAKKYEIEEFSLIVPKDSKDREADFRNSVALYEHFKGLPGYVLSDERFWAWVNFEIGYETALRNMPVDGGKAVFKDHWLFTQGKRRGLFFGVLSRCYYRVSLTVDETLEDKYELTRFVIDNPERFRNLSWRAFSSESSIVLGALKAEKRVLEEHRVEEKPDYYTELAKEISRMGSVRLLDCMTETEIEELVYEAFTEIVENDDKNISAKGAGQNRADLASSPLQRIRHMFHHIAPEQ